MYRTHRQKISKYIENFENTNNQLYRIDIIKVPPNDNRIQDLFNTHRKFMKIDHILYYKGSLSKF